MRSFMSEDATRTKFYKRSKTFLEVLEWQQMLLFKSVKDVILFLKSKPKYDKMLGLVDENMHRDEIENLLNKAVVKEIELTLNYLSGPYKLFVKTFLMQYEIHDLQLILRTVAKEESTTDLKRHFLHSRHFRKIDYDRVLNSNNVRAVVDNLRGTVYYDSLKTFNQKDATNRAFHMEMKLNLLYYKTLMDRAKRLHKNDYQMIDKIIGSKIDCLNLQWIYRAKKYFSISKEEIFIYSLPEGYKLSSKRLKDLIYADTIEQFMALAKEYVGADLFEQGDEFLDTQINKVTYQNILQFKDGKDLAFIVYYIYHLKIEVKEMIAVIEGIRYGLPIRQIKKYLVYNV